jgi:hypothetical protein
MELERAEGAVPVQGPEAKSGETYARCDIEDVGFGGYTMQHSYCGWWNIDDGVRWLF